MFTNFASSYLAYLGGQFLTVHIMDAQMIVAPFLDRHNDWLTVYVSPIGERLRLTDGGAILDDLAMSGREVDWATLRETLAGFNVEERQKELCVECMPAQFGEAFHRLLQAMWAAAWS